MFAPPVNEIVERLGDGPSVVASSTTCEVAMVEEKEASSTGWLVVTTVEVSVADCCTCPVQAAGPLVVVVVAVVATGGRFGEVCAAIG